MSNKRQLSKEEQEIIDHNDELRAEGRAEAEPELAALRDKLASAKAELDQATYTEMYEGSEQWHERCTKLEQQLAEARALQKG